MSGTAQRQAVIYCRVSSLKQVTVGDGLKSQETRCREFARMKGYEVVEIFKDDITGKLIERPGMKAMLAFIRKRRTSGTAVLIDDISRLARGLQAHLELRGAIAKAGGILESPSIEFGEDPDSILVENLLASVSQHQRQKNGEQTRNRMKARIQNGYFVFQAPAGYRYARVSGRGKMLVRDEPAASVVQEALEGYASGRFENQAEVMRFLQANPLFPKDATGIVRHQRVGILLTNPVYAGYVEAPDWGVSLRAGQHEGLISWQTYKRIQERLNGATYAPRQKNINEDFPLRGYVGCAHCGTRLTACWSKGTHGKHPYYLCPKRGCESYGKSIRRDRIEGEFETLLQKLQPSERLFKVAVTMFKELWDHRLKQGESQAKALGAQLVKVERQVAQLLDRILDASVPTVIRAYEAKVRELEEQKLLIEERMAGESHPAASFNDGLRTALGFLASPWNLWNTGRLEDRRAVLKLAFAGQLEYARNEGFRTTDLSLPFKVLGAFSAEKKEMAHPKRFELLTPRFVVWCSIQLSYGCVWQRAEPLAWRFSTNWPDRLQAEMSRKSQKTPAISSAL